MIEYTILVALVVAITSVIKKVNKPEKLSIPFMDERYLPFIAIIVGVSVNLASTLTGSDLIFDGIIAGLISMGFYDGGKSAVLTVKEIKTTIKK